MSARPIPTKPNRSVAGECRCVEKCILLPTYSIITPGECHFKPGFLHIIVATLAILKFNTCLSNFEWGCRLNCWRQKTAMDTFYEGCKQVMSTTFVGTEFSPDSLTTFWPQPVVVVFVPFVPSSLCHPKSLMCCQFHPLKSAWRDHTFVSGNQEHLSLWNCQRCKPSHCTWRTWLEKRLCGPVNGIIICMLLCNTQQSFHNMVLHDL